MILQSALNESKLENRVHLPIIRIESVDQLRTFMDECGEFYDEPYANTPAFDEETSDMNEAYLKKYTVFLVRILATSGSYRYGVAEVQVDGNSLCVYVEQINHPENGTADMEEWFAVVSISKDKVAGCIEYDAIIR